MKVRQTGLFVPLKKGKLLLDATSSALQYHNVKIVMKPYITDEIAEIFLSPLPDGNPDFRIAKILIKYSIKTINKRSKRKRRDRKEHKKYARKLLAQLKRCTVYDDESEIDINQQANVCCYSPLQNDMQFLTTTTEVINNETDPSNSVSANNNTVDSKLTQTDVEEKFLTKNETVIEMKNASTSDTMIRTGLRPVIIDGSNVAFSHGRNIYFSFEGLKICINYFKKLGHRVIAVLPNFRKGRVDNCVLKDWESDGTLLFTPSRRINGYNIVCQDDRFIIQIATDLQGVIVSLDQYRNYLGLNNSWDETIKERLLMFTWVNDKIMFPDDPLGPNGPPLDTFLQFPNQQ